MTRYIIALKNYFIVTKLIYFQWNEKLSRISMYTHALIVDVMIAISSDPLNNIQPHIMDW